MYGCWLGCLLSTGRLALAVTRIFLRWLVKKWSKVLKAIIASHKRILIILQLKIWHFNSDYHLLRVNLRNLYLPCFVFPLHVWDVAQHDVDEGVLDQAEEHEERTRRHENVNCLKKSKKKIIYHSCYQKDLDYLAWLSPNAHAIAPMSREVIFNMNFCAQMDPKCVNFQRHKICR